MTALGPLPGKVTGPLTYAIISQRNETGNQFWTSDVTTSHEGCPETGPARDKAGEAATGGCAQIDNLPEKHMLLALEAQHQCLAQIPIDS